uniref:TOX high mobility group box family member 4 a n=1 Tax=Fundulus heteroclitus TaxID=8078 RepID=A0A3Q2QV06_FUNHE
MQFSEASDSYLTIGGAGHHFLSAETFHTPSLGDEVFEIPPISLDPDQALSIGEAVSHFDLTDSSEDTSGSSGSRSLVSNLVVEANDPSFASTFVNSGSQGLEQLSLGTMGQGGGGALLSSSALEMGNSGGSHFSRSPPMTIDVQLSDLGHGLLEGTALGGINPSELTLGLGGGNAGRHSEAPDEPLLISSSPVGSLQDEDMDDFKRSVLVDSPVSLSSSPILSHVSSYSAAPTPVSPAAAGAKKGRKKKDPNEPQKPVSAYALFFRDTQSAIKGQNPNASFGEVSKIVASMWDSLVDDQKQVYKKKTEAAKKEYLKALAAYKASQLSQVTPPVVNLSPAAPPSAGQQAFLLPSANSSMDASICASNIILDVPEVAPPSHSGANQAAAPAGVLPPSQTITKIIIPKHLAARQPPPLQQMQNAPPPPRLQQMAPAPPPLQAKPREGATTLSQPVTFAATSPPPLQIKIVPASVQDRLAATVLVPSAAAAPVCCPVKTIPAPEPWISAAPPDMCVRAGCTNPAVDSDDWDKEYCSNECVATHCKDVFRAWCSIRNQNLGTVK